MDILIMLKLIMFFLLLIVASGGIMISLECYDILKNRFYKKTN